MCLEHSSFSFKIYGVVVVFGSCANLGFELPKHGWPCKNGILRRTSLGQ